MIMGKSLIIAEKNSMARDIQSQRFFKFVLREDDVGWKLQIFFFNFIPSF